MDLIQDCGEHLLLDYYSKMHHIFQV